MSLVSETSIVCCLSVHVCVVVPNVETTCVVFTGWRVVSVNLTCSFVGQAEFVSIQEVAENTACSSAQTKVSTDNGCSDTDTSGFFEERAARLLCCCGKCSIKELGTNGCPSSGGKLRRFPLLSLNHLSNGEKIKLIARLHDESERVAKKFASLVREVLRVDVNELVVHLLSLKALQYHPKLVNKQILESFEPKLSACKNLPELIIILSTACVVMVQPLSLGNDDLRICT